ncbi:GL11618 [Drosophila persimilis]|uniref:FXNA-like protease n=1 Tax=Drosophila persimilis TaxID=7234 RepID=B4GCD3_DROPE|nr:endoplasmic reticulum metallopeptidase 1 [Drosophila persimilis]XP_026840671.1 endoplasmic reticulum metallopeptidase 1 [Drosophila persimilis]XP_026840672.1 endoplasmic reticulum metallopeptidase 1 [Drosophila persimilis]EDW32410.1 GL11618 [Drosophila persimilis]
MSFNSKYHIDVDFEVPKKLQWYYAPVFFAFWLCLYLSLVNTQINSMPKALMRSDEASHPNSFIAQRAEDTLIELTRIGPRVVGSAANEVATVDFLRAEVAKVEAEMSDRYEIEIDVQQASGAYMHWEMVNMYQGIQNVVVKLSERNSSNENFLLMNSHYDSVPGSPGAGDDGSMVVSMLEVMRVIAKAGEPLAHPIVFLFNGAEENPLQGSHAFITQHKWAKNCKALINLDSAGSGGREILFQSGPNHPWLMNYYRNVPHPFANTLGEEMFQAGIIPSDTDFRIFRDYGGVPGLDMAYIFNGFVYHTKYDRINAFPRASFQHTGDNVLSLARALANAPEMDDTAAHAEGHNIFYDFLGWFMIFYTETTSIIVNVVVSLLALLAIGISLYFMSVRSGCSWKGVLLRYAITIGMQLASLALAVGLALLVAVFMDGVNRSMTWFTSTWTIFGLYLAPIIFGMSILPALYLEKTKRDPLGLGFRIQLFMHSHCFWLIVIMVTLTGLSIRSAYLIMLCVLFDIVALIVNLVTKWHRKAYLFAIAVTVCQILPFVYFTYLCTAALLTLMPMQGRSGSSSNPDMVIAALVWLFSLMFAGFVVPLIMFFRKTRTIVLCFLGITILFIVIAVTNAGFPYKEKTSAQRYSLIHAHRRLHNADGTTRMDESGLYIYPQDRRIEIARDEIDSIGEVQRVSDTCDEEMFCGLPLYNHRWNKARKYSLWVPVPELPEIPTEYPSLILQDSSELESATRRRFSFSLSGPDHMGIFVNMKNDAKLVDWSFNDTLVREKAEPPYMVYFSYGLDNSSLEFTIDVEKTTSTFDTPTLEIGIGGHWVNQDITAIGRLSKYIDRFPSYAYIQGWVGTYETWYF